VAFPIFLDERRPKADNSKEHIKWEKLGSSKIASADSNDRGKSSPAIELGEGKKVKESDEELKQFVDQCYEDRAKLEEAWEEELKAREAWERKQAEGHTQEERYGTSRREAQGQPVVGPPRPPSPPKKPYPLVEDDEPLENFGSLLRSLREERGLSLQDVAARAKEYLAPRKGGRDPVSKSALSLYERGEVKGLKPQILWMFSRVYDYPYEKLVRVWAEERFHVRISVLSAEQAHSELDSQANRFPAITRSGVRDELTNLQKATSDCPVVFPRLWANLDAA
jgi:transcriptional regulator with XRE-family HTH domain